MQGLQAPLKSGGVFFSRVLRFSLFFCALLAFPHALLWSPLPVSNVPRYCYSPCNVHCLKNKMKWNELWGLGCRLRVEEKGLILRSGNLSEGTGKGRVCSSESVSRCKINANQRSETCWLPMPGSQRPPKQAFTQSFVSPEVPPTGISKTVWLRLGTPSGSGPPDQTSIPAPLAIVLWFATTFSNGKARRGFSLLSEICWVRVTGALYPLMRKINISFYFSCSSSYCAFNIGFFKGFYLGDDSF